MAADAKRRSAEQHEPDSEACTDARVAPVEARLGDDLRRQDGARLAAAAHGLHLVAKHRVRHEPFRRTIWCAR